jgi:hypothetical protein
MTCHFSVQSGLASVIRPDSPFWVHAVFHNFTFCDYELRLVAGPLVSATPRQDFAPRSGVSG